ncbi:hypothetical protein PLESTM_000783200 [Pleodorina starrii]|nr:hypothetical protein PLESTM_000783200 [Pleodorina starrii]
MVLGLPRGITGLLRYLQNIITALGVALCRHGMLLRLVNLFGGERHAYCTSTVQSILQAGTGIRFMWYDIACRWGRSYEKWLVEQDDRLREVGAGMTYLIPPWHRYAHSFSCQKDFGHPTVPEVGRGTGEPAEVWNSVIGPHGSVLQYMSPANRESHVERTGRHYCRQAALGMAFRLWRMKARAEGALEAMTRQLSRLENALAAGSQQSVEQVRSRLQEKCEEEEQRRKRQLMPPPQGQGEQQRQAQAEQAARFVKGEYARCRLALDKLQRCDILDAETDAVSLGLLYPGADSASIRQRPVLIRSIRTRLEELESQHAINPADWVDGSEAFKAGLAELAKGEVLKLQSELEEAVADYWSLEYVIQHLSGRRKEQGYAIRDKSQTKQRIEGMWGRLVSWCNVAGAVSAALASAIKEPDALQKAMGQKFPWGVEGGPQEGKTSRLRAALLRSYHDRKRGNEEVALIVAEIEKAINKCERRVQLLSDALSQSDDRTLPGRLRLLRLHLGRNERMLVAFRLLKEGQIPRDQSAIIDEDW